jgi:hypothetical protein
MPAWRDMLPLDEADLVIGRAVDCLRTGFFGNTRWQGDDAEALVCHAHSLGAQRSRAHQR